MNEEQLAKLPKRQVAMEDGIEKIYLYKDDLAVDTFDRATRIQDWRNYVQSDLRELWPTLTQRERRIIAIQAQAQADAEEWD